MVCYPVMSCPHTTIASLSPGGNCVVCANAVRVDAAVRFDAWQNALTGIGNALTDKRMSTTFDLEIILPEYAEQLWRGDDLAARIVETWPNEMLRQGYDVTVAEDDSSETDESYVDAASRGDGAAWVTRKRARMDAKKKGEKLQDLVTKKLEELGANEAFHKALCYRRAYGGGAILLGANDGVADLQLPLKEDAVSSIDFLTVLEPRELMPLYYYADPRAPKFGQVAIYQLQTIAPGAPMPSEKNFGITLQRVHESRLIVFMGSRVTRRVTNEAVAGWGDNVFTRCNRVLSDFNVSWASAGILVHDFAQAIFKIKGLAEAMAMDKDDLLKIRMRAVELSRSTARAVLIDSEEDFKREQTPVAGLPELLDRFMSRLAAAADMPLTLLMGQSPGGLNATGDSDVRFFYDRVSSAQERDLRPALERLIRLILISMGGDEPDQWGVEFRPLWQATEKEQADARFVQAQTDQIYIVNDVVSPDEIAKSRFGGDQYSFQTQIDFDARERFEVAAPRPVLKPGEDPNAEPDPLEVPPGGSPFGAPPGGAGGKPPPFGKPAAGKKPGAKKPSAKPF